MEKKLFLVTTTLWNGTIQMTSSSCVVPTMDLAQKTKDAVDKANADCVFGNLTEIREISFFEFEEDVPILNKEEHHE